MAKFRARNAENFGLRVRTGNGQRTVIGYDVDRGGIYVDRTESGDVSFSPSFPSVEFAPVALKNGYITLRVLVDRSSVEVFEGRGGSPSPTRSSRIGTAKGFSSSPKAAELSSKT